MESETERNAQDWFRFMVDTNLAPGLRALGFFGVGRRFRIESPQHWGEVAVEQSRSYTARAVRFTLHIGVMSRDEWAEQLRVRPVLPGERVGEGAGDGLAGPDRHGGGSGRLPHR